MHVALLIGGVLLACFVSFCIGCATGWYACSRVEEIRREEELDQANEEKDDGPST